MYSMASHGLNNRTDDQTMISLLQLSHRETTTNFHILETELAAALLNLMDVVVWVTC